MRNIILTALRWAVVVLLGKFEVIVPRDGEYKITVEAKHAIGSIAIIKNQHEDEK